MKQLLALPATLLALLIVCVTRPVATADEPRASSQPLDPAVETMVNTYCLDCHNSGEPTAGLDLETISTRSVADDLDEWEQVVKKLRAHQMPPSDMDQPEESTIVEVVNTLEELLDQVAVDHPQPGRTDTFRRLTRFEYQNAIRDLLSLDIDVTTHAPGG